LDFLQTTLAKSFKEFSRIGIIPLESRKASPEVSAPLAYKFLQLAAKESVVVVVATGTAQHPGGCRLVSMKRLLSAGVGQLSKRPLITILPAVRVLVFGSMITCAQ
jgi:hypothetical protein